MGKRKTNQGSKYEHNHTYNPKAHGSDERKRQAIQNIEIKRLKSYVEKNMAKLKRFIPEQEHDSNKKQKIDPLYNLKGAAAPAKEFYRQPGLEDESEPIDLFSQLMGHLYDHKDGQALLKSMLELGISFHNIANKSKDAIKVFKEMMEYDKSDRMFARHHLLRCYLDLGHADHARALLDSFPSDQSSCFAYSRALIEHISTLLQEKGSSQMIKDEMLDK
eukprot:gene9373-12629_t